MMLHMIQNMVGIQIFLLERILLFGLEKPKFIVVMNIYGKDFNS